MIRATDLKVCLSAHDTQYSVSGKNSKRAAGISLPQSKHLHIAGLAPHFGESVAVVAAYITVSVNECVECCGQFFLIAHLKNGNSSFHFTNQIVVAHAVVVVVGFVHACIIPQMGACVKFKTVVACRRDPRAYS